MPIRPWPRVGAAASERGVGIGYRGRAASAGADLVALVRLRVRRGVLENKLQGFRRKLQPEDDVQVDISRIEGLPVT